MAFALFALALPASPGHTLQMVARGLLVSLAAVSASMSVFWTAPVALLQAMRAPRSMVAFATLLARHLVSLRQDVIRTQRALLLRGAWDRIGSIGQATRALLLHLLPVTLARADQLADAMALRGFQGRIPELPPWKPSRQEVPAYAMASVACVALISEWMGWSRSSWSW